MKALVFVALMATTFMVFAVDRSYAAHHKLRAFSSYDDAFKAMIDAVRADDEKELFALFGPEGKDLFPLRGGTEGEARERFVKAYDEKHRIETRGVNKAVLRVGKNDWPWPVPVVKVSGHWRFDVNEGKAEVLARRIGKNEVSAVQVSLAYVDSQHEYGDQHQAKGMMEYAQQLASDPGKKNGLCWETKKGETPSLLGPHLAAACMSGTKAGAGVTPYHGYFYKILTKQGTNAPGGAYDYVVNGKMIGGFGLIAYPAVYGSFGITTFIVNQQGVVYQKDLGPNTEKAAEAMTAFDPDETWKKVD